VFLRSLIALLAVATVAAGEDKHKARAALALAAACEPAPVGRDANGRTIEQAAKAALAEAAGLECECGVCDVPKPMPTPVQTVIRPACKTVAELVDYATLRTKIEALKPGESVRLFAGVDVVDDCSFSGTAYKMTGPVPGFPAGIWRCWKTADGVATMQRLHLAGAK
jgi:hypothetical protein